MDAGAGSAPVGPVQITMSVRDLLFIGSTIDTRSPFPPRTGTSPPQRRAWLSG
ncbi:hypothetical protein QFZ60_001774 [Arthrobacter sp. B2I5]|nr:hypothetical protein [Arthrobacter sp. B2I5]